MKFLLQAIFAIMFLHAALVFADAPKKAVASPALQKEFDGFIAKFRTALKAGHSAAVAGMAQLPFMADPDIRDAAQFVAKIYRPTFTAKARACIQRGRGVYERDGLNNDNYSIICGQDIFVFTKTPTGFLLTEIGMND